VPSRERLEQLRGVGRDVRGARGARGQARDLRQAQGQDPHRAGGGSQHGLDARRDPGGREERDADPGGLAGDQPARQLRERAYVAESEPGEHDDVNNAATGVGFSTARHGTRLVAFLQSGAIAATELRYKIEQI